MNSISVGSHSYRSLGSDFYVDMELCYVPDSQLVLFNKELAQQLNLDLPESDEALEQLMVENFSWFKSEANNLDGNKMTKTLFSTRYQDSDNKNEGSALGDGRATWAGEIVITLACGQLQYRDVVLKGTGVTPLAWLDHPRESHKDGQLGLTEAVHEYIYSMAATKNGINAVGVLAVIKLPFYRQVDNENAAIIVRVGNHLRFAHYCYFADNATQLKKLFEYGLKRDMGLSLTHFVNSQDVQEYMALIVTNLAADAAIYFDVHAVHGSPTFGNITSCGRTIDFATFVFIDAHHGNYSYMSEGANQLGGEWGQTEQFFNLFSILVDRLKNSGFGYEAEIKPVEYFLESFNEKFEQILTRRWLLRLGLSLGEIASLSLDNKEHFYETVKMLYEQQGSKKIKFKSGKIFMAAFEPRKILSATASCIEKFDGITVIWESLFKVERIWGTYKLVDAKPYIKVYQKAVVNIVEELKASSADIAIWQQRSKDIGLAERNEPGTDFFYDSERFFASEEVVQKIKLGNSSWRKMSEMADEVTTKLADHGFIS